MRGKWYSTIIVRSCLNYQNTLIYCKAEGVFFLRCKLDRDGVQVEGPDHVEGEVGDPGMVQALQEPEESLPV